MELFKLFGTIAVNNADANNAIDESSDKAESFHSKLSTGIGKAAKWGTAIVGGATAATGALVKFAESSASTADNIDKMSQKIGISKQAYQELDFICSQSGTSVDTLQAGMKSLTAAMDGAASGTESNVEQFQKLGVSVTDANGNLRSQEEVMWETLSALQGMENQTEKARLATELFGRSGTELMPLLNGASGSIDEMKQQAHDLGLVLEDDVIDSGVSLTDTLDQMKRAFGSIVTKLGAALMPILEQVAKYIIGAMPKIQSLFERLAPIITQLFEGLLPPLMNLCETLLPVIFDLLETLIPVVSNILEALLPVIIDLLNMLLPPLVQIIEMILPLLISLIEPLLPLLEPIFALLQPIIDLLMMILEPLIQLLNLILPPLIEAISFIIQGVLAVLQPILEWFADFLGNVLGGVITGITDLIGWCAEGFKAAWEGIKIVWSIVVDFFKGIWDGISNIFSVVADWFKGIFEKANAAIHTVIDPWIEIFGKIWNGIKEKFASVASFFGDIFKKAWDNIKKVFEPVASFFTGIWNSIKNAFSSVTNWFKDVFSKAWQAVKDVFSTGGKIFDGIKDGIVNVFKTVVNAIIRGINKVISIPFNAINSVLGKIRDISILGVEPFGWISTINTPQIPELEKGGVLKKGQVGLLEGKGDEAVVPLEKNTGWIRNVATQIHDFVIETKNNPKDIAGNISSTGLLTALKVEVGDRIRNLEETITNLIDMLKEFFPELLEAFDVTIVLDDGTMVARLTPKIDRELGKIQRRKERG